MKRWVTEVKLQPGVELIYLPGNRQNSHNIIVCMTFIADLINKLRPWHLYAPTIYSRYTSSGSGDEIGTNGWITIGLVWVVAIRTLNVIGDTTRWREDLVRNVQASKILNEMSILFC